MRFLILLLLCSKSAFAVQATPHRCTDGEVFVRAYHRAAYLRADGTHVSAANIKQHCRKLSTNEVFWAKRINNGRPDNWPHKLEKSKAWSDQDKEVFLDAVNRLPNVLNIDSIKSVYRMDKSVFEANPSSQALGMIIFYDRAFSNESGIARYLAHELSHEIYDRDYELQKSYDKATGWSAFRDGSHFYWNSRKSGYVETDGENSPEEDFANNIEYFLFEPEKLKQVTPAAFQWITKRFGDKLMLKGEHNE